MGFYAYLHARPDVEGVFSIFYVGKGTLYRYRSLNPRNSYYKNIVNKCGKENILISKIDCSTESFALLLEKGLIKCLRSMGVKLSNMTDGGDGVSGLKWSEASKLKSSEKRKGIGPSEETKLKIKEALKGRAPTNLGVSHSEEVKAKISKALKGVPKPLSMRANLSKARTGMKFPRNKG